MYINAYFSAKGVPKTGLTPTIWVWGLDGTAVISGSNMAEIAGGYYYYNFTGYDDTEDYSIRADGGDILSNIDRYVCATNEVEYHEQLDDIETTVSGIKERTDNLPDDPADQSQIEAAITTAEGNIRGADNDDLKIISDQIDTINIDTDYIETTVSGIKERTDNLPDSPAPADEYDSEFTAIQTDLDNPSQYKADVSTLAIEANVEGHATAALNSYDSPTRAEATSDKDEIIVEVNANETKLDTIDGVVDAIKLKTDAINWSDITFLRDIEGGKWELKDNQMIFYKSDNVTVVATFDLFDKNDDPSVESVYKRVRV